MAALTWKEGKVISIETRENIFVLAQLGPEPYLIIFNLFSHNDVWKDVELTPESILFCHAVTRSFLKRSKLTEKKHIESLKTIEYPKYWISKSPNSYTVKIWAGTPDEMNFLSLGEGGASLVENDITVSGFKETKIIIPVISPNDKETINKFELTSISIYPEFNERLFLCYKFKKNVDPAKALLFNHDLPVEYKRYFQIVSGQVELSELGY